MICLYLKIPEDRFGVAHISFVYLVKFKLLAQFPVDNLVMKLLLLLLDRNT